MNNFTRIYLLLFCLFLATSVHAQLTGTITVPSTTYPDLASVITALNTQGVGAGGVIINVTAGNAQTAPTGGYLLGSTILNASTAAIKTITINGNGNTITAFTPGIGTADGIFKMAGVDYVTINNLNLQENAANTTDIAQMEWGYALVKLNNVAPFDGCNHITIQNCNIALALPVTAVAANTSAGIFMGHTIATDVTALAVTGAAEGDRQNNNTFDNNTITAMRGVYQIGMNSASLYDYNITVKRNKLNFGGGTVAAYGLYIQYDSVATILNNTFTINTAHATSGYGVNMGLGSGNADIENNTFSLTDNSFVTGALYGFNNASHKDTSATFTFANNTLSNWSFPAIIGGNVYGFNNGGAFRTLNVTNNIFSNITTAATQTGGIYVLYNTAFAVPFMNVTGNKAINLNKGGTGGVLQIIYSYSSALYGVHNVSNNLISKATSSASGTLTSVYVNCGTVQATYIQNNKVDSVTMTGTGILYGYYSTAGGLNLEVANDTFSNSSSTTGNLYGLYSGSASPIIHDNVLYNLTASTGVLYGSFTTIGSPILYNNRFNKLQLTGTSGTIYGMYFNTVRDTAIIYNNTIADYTVAANYSAPSSLYGLYLQTANAYKVYQNTISIGATSTGANFGATGIYYLPTATLLDIRNNIVNVNVTPAGTGFTAALRKSTGTVNVAPTNITATSGGNIYYAPNATNSYLYAEGSATPLVNAYNLTNDANFNTSCSLYKAFNLNDPNSFTENILVAGTGSYSYAPTGISYAEKNGVPVSGIAATDAMGVTRTSPADAGALQFNGTFAAATAPYITYTALPVISYCNASPLLALNITDVNGINNTVGTAPRIYYKKATENNAFGNYPADNVSTFNGWKYTEATGSGSAFSVTPDYSKLTAAVAVGDSISYFIVAQNNATTPKVGNNKVVFNTGFCPASVVLSSTAAPVATTGLNGYKIVNVPSFIAVGALDSVCNGDGTVISLSPAPNGLAIQWQQDSTTGTYKNITGFTASTYNTPALLAGNNYKAVLSCNSSVVATSSAIGVGVNAPVLLAANGNNRCGAGRVALSAVGSSNSLLRWYSTATGGNPLDTGAIFNTPIINATTTYYVTAGKGNTTKYVGRTAPSSIEVGASSIAGLTFNAYVPFNLKSVTVFPVGTGTSTVVIMLLNATGDTLQRDTTTMTGTASPGIATVMPLNFSIPAGTGYQLRMTLRTGTTVTLMRDINPVSVSFPYTLPGVMSITGGSVVATYYSYFYNWSIGTTCETSRFPAIATVNLNAPAFNITGTQTVCNNSVAAISVTTGASNYDSYTFTPATNLYTDAAGTIPYTGTAATTVYAKTTTVGTGTILATAYNTISQCGSVDSVKISVQPVPLTTTNTPDTICQWGSARLILNPATGYAANSIQWQSSANGTTYTDVTGATSATYTTAYGSTAKYYRAQVKNSANAVCAQPADTINIQNPIVSSSLPGNICGNGAVTLSATAANDATLLWYNTATSDTALDTGATYITPTLSNTTTFYVSANNQGKGYVGKINDISGTLTNQTIGLKFNAIKPFILLGVYVYPVVSSGSATGQADIQLLDKFGTLLQTITFNATGTLLPGVKTFVPLNFFIPEDTAYQLKVTNFSGIALTQNGGGTVSFPYILPGVTSIIGSTSGSITTYYYLYDWLISTGCESPRVPVVATVNTPPAITVNPATQTICDGDMVTLTASSSNIGYTYSWAPTNAPTSSINVTPSATTTYNVTATDNTNGANKGCTIGDSIVITVNPSPNATIQNNSGFLSTGSFNSYQWLLNGQEIGGATSSTYIPTTNGVYSVVVTNSSGCKDTATFNYNDNAVANVGGNKNMIHVYPNPATEMVYIDAPANTHIELTSIDGKLLQQQDNIKQINIHGYADGVYMVRITDMQGNMLQVSKIIKTTN